MGTAQQAVVTRFIPGLHLSELFYTEAVKPIIERAFFFPVSVPADLYRPLPDAEPCILPNTGHVPPAERPAWFNAIVLDFLARRGHEAPGPG